MAIKSKLRPVHVPNDDGTYLCTYKDSNIVLQLSGFRTTRLKYFNKQFCDFRCIGAKDQCPCVKYESALCMTGKSGVNMFDLMAVRQRMKMPS
jgi:hypothetical protein